MFRQPFPSSPLHWFGAVTLLLGLELGSDRLPAVRGSITPQVIRSAPRKDYSALDINTSDARLLVIDPKGARTGNDPVSSEELAEIPQSGVDRDAIDDDVTGEAATGFSVTVNIATPAEGTYRVVMVGLGHGSSKLRVDVFSTDGSPQPVLSIPRAVEKGSRAEFRLHFLSSPGAKSSLERIEPGGPR
jgi:hypothetical protein